MHDKKAEGLECRGKERRSDLDRRRFSYLVHIPERRSGRDRRKFAAGRYGTDPDPKKDESSSWNILKHGRVAR